MSRFQPIPSHPRCEGIPHPRFKNLYGKTFGRWTVLGYVGKRGKNRNSFWLCRCECGAEKEVNSSSLIRGGSRSCGCYQNETRGSHRLTHGMSSTKTYRVWQSMIDRCTNKKCEKYEHYGGRGICVCDRWKNSFESFLTDMGERPKNHTIERVNNDGNYSPDNCRWATWEAQRNNKRTSRLVTFQGKTQTLNQWAKELGVDRTMLRDRLNKGMPPEEAFTKPSRKPKTLCHNGKTLTLSEWSNKTGIPLTTIKSRLKVGCNAADALRH